MVIYMERNKNTFDFAKNKGFRGYTETLSQYTGEGANVVINVHSNSHMNFHSHDFFEINYISTGQCSNLFESGSVDMQEGDFILIHPDSVHSLFVNNASKVYNFLISKGFYLSTLLNGERRSYRI